MPTAVLQLDVGAMPDGLDLPERYDEALILVRRGVELVALVTLPVHHGRIDSVRLREAIIERGGNQLLRLEVGESFGTARAPVDASGVTVAVCTRDRPEDLDRCLTALSRLSTVGHELLVVDNASVGEATQQVAEAHPGVRYVREDRPGLDIARNRAMREARGEIVAFCDDDAVPEPRWLGALIAGFKSPRTLCVTGLTLPLELETEAQVWFERTNAFFRGLNPVLYDGAVADPFLVARIGAGVNMALRTSVLERIGPFDEALDAGTAAKSGGDHDMFTRILIAGYCIAYEPAAISHHRHRREWQHLRDTVRGYGTGVYALLTKHLVEGGEWRTIGIALGWGLSQVRLLVRSLLRRAHAPPLDLVVAELRGCMAGPRAYRIAKRRLRDDEGARVAKVGVGPATSP